MACGNNHVSRDYLSTPPSTASPLTQIVARLPNDSSDDRLKGEVWTTSQGRFEDKSGAKRAHADVVSPGEKRWDFKPDSGAGPKGYTHMTGRTGWLGPASLLERLPAETRKSLESRRVIVLGTEPGQRWVNERATAFTSGKPHGKPLPQTTVVRRAR
ncbi:MAG: hypothetical protein M3256_20755 [Actinomycetota bacterium]|nr:hypothetical protein [Actinomycetota bacterium]